MATVETVEQARRRVTEAGEELRRRGEACAEAEQRLAELIGEDAPEDQIEELERRRDDLRRRGERAAIRAQAAERQVTEAERAQAGADLEAARAAAARARAEGDRVIAELEEILTGVADRLSRLRGLAQDYRRAASAAENARRRLGEVSSAPAVGSWPGVSREVAAALLATAREACQAAGMSPDSPNAADLARRFREKRRM